MHTYTHTYTHTYIHTYNHSFILHRFICKYIQCWALLIRHRVEILNALRDKTNIYIYTYWYIHIHTCTYIYIYTCIYIYIYTYIYIRTYIYVCTYICMYTHGSIHVCLHMCMYVCTRGYIFSYIVWSSINQTPRRDSKCPQGRRYMTSKYAEFRTHTSIYWIRTPVEHVQNLGMDLCVGKHTLDLQKLENRAGEHWGIY